VRGHEGTDLLNHCEDIGTIQVYEVVRVKWKHSNSGKLVSSINGVCEFIKFSEKKGSFLLL